jgi:ArsR family transcriptional regulator, lead/cadmium/zinc/bismuth-responsive transcriptional repressor
MVGLFGALADRTRASIVHTLLQQELCTLDLVLGLPPPTVSQHLRVLRDLRLVRSRRHGRLVLYHLDDAHVAQMVSIGLAHEGEGRRD